MAEAPTTVPLTIVVMASIDGGVTHPLGTGTVQLPVVATANDDGGMGAATFLLSVDQSQVPRALAQVLRETADTLERRTSS